VGQVAHEGNEKRVQNCGRKVKGRDHFGNLGVDWRIILKSLQIGFSEFGLDSSGSG
jgi:hypothetical protein